MSYATFKQWDIKYFRKLHVAKQKSQWNSPVSYPTFTRRLHKMNLHDAIYFPRVEYNVRSQTPKTPIQDNIRRMQTLKEENVQILDLDELTKIENIELPKKNKNRYHFKPKQSLRNRFISFFK